MESFKAFPIPVFVFLFVSFLCLTEAAAASFNQSASIAQKTVAEGFVASTFDVSCYDSSAVPYVGKIPDSNNCDRYFVCEEIQGYPSGFQHECRLNLYDFNSCECKEKTVAKCFEAFNPEHQGLRFKCATPV